MTPKYENVVYCFIALLIMLVIPNFLISQNAFAYTISFNPLPPLLTRVPTLCAVEPDDPNLSSGQLSLIMEQVQNRVSEWPTHLQDGMPFSHNWNIKYTVVTPDISQSFDYSNCDIKLILKSAPDSYDSSPHNALGYEQYDPSSARHLIVVFYESYYYCKNSPYDSNYSVCITGNVPPPQLGNVILHETGHALGLGHYVSDDDKVNAFWSTNPTDAPSIMVPYSKYDPTKEYIQQVDVQKLHEIYGIAGFTAFSPKTSPNPFESLNVNPSVIGNEGQKNTMVNIVGHISYQFYSRGNQVEIIVTDQNGVTVFDQSFLTTQEVSQTVVTDGWSNGVYTVKAKYGAYESQDIQFVKSDSVVQSIPPPTSMPPVSAPSAPQQNSIASESTIPEFGSIAHVILLIAFISIITIFAKMRLVKTNVD